ARGWPSATRRPHPPSATLPRFRVRCSRRVHPRLPMPLPMPVRPRPAALASRACAALAALLAALLGAPLAVHAAAAPKAPAKPTSRAFTLEHVLALRQVQSPVWSRDGRRLAFVVNAPDTAENTTNQDIWIWEEY